MPRRRRSADQHPELGLPEVRKLWEAEGLFSDHYLKARLKKNDWWPSDAEAQPVWQFCKELYEKRAFASIRDDLKHLYSLSYYPHANPNHGWRAIKVKLVGERLKKYHIRTRDGYRPQPSRFSATPATDSPQVADPAVTVRNKQSQ